GRAPPGAPRSSTAWGPRAPGAAGSRASFREAVGQSAPGRLGKTTLSALGRHPTFDRIRARRNRRGGTGTAGSARTGVAATTSAGAGRGASSTVGRVNRPVQRVIIIALALLLVVPLGVMGLGGLLGPGGEEQTEQDPTAQDPQDPEDRPTADPAEQPPRPDLPRPDEPAGLTPQSAEGAAATPPCGRTPWTRSARCAGGSWTTPRCSTSRAGTSWAAPSTCIRRRSPATASRRRPGPWSPSSLRRSRSWWTTRSCRPTSSA